MNIKKLFRRHILILLIIFTPVLFIYAGQPVKFFHAKSIADSTETFFENPFGYQVSLQNFLHNISRLKVNSHPVSNHYHKEQIDTVYTLSYRLSEIKLYKTKDKTLLISADIQNRRIKLYGDIHVGMKKKQLTQMLSGFVKTNNQTIILNDDEGQTTYSFHFSKREKLDQIKIITNIE